MDNKKMRQLVASCIAFAAAALLIAVPMSVSAYPKWQSRAGGMDYCALCHGEFRNVDYTSQKDGTPWNSDLMDGHKSFLDDCDSCHRGNFNDGVWLNASDSNERPKSCVGCHGRDEDINDSCTGLSGSLDGIEAECGSGAGLRRHHENSPVFNGSCVGCHVDDPDPAGEDIAPFNYGMAGVDIGDPCDTDGSESVFGSTGLDNDGDGSDDGADMDCMPTTDADGDGVDDSGDNCIDMANSDQRDSDSDDIGNACDPDIEPLPNDCQVNFLDLNALKNAFFSDPASPGWNPDADFDGNDIVNFLDLQQMKDYFFGSPGPSAAGCN